MHWFADFLDKNDYGPTLNEAMKAVGESLLLDVRAGVTEKAGIVLNRTKGVVIG